MALLRWLSEGCFRWSLRNQLVYPSCWEDPRVDRAALRITGDDSVLVITSGGCNALAYALDEPRHVYAVDLNFRQNALLELKLVGIKRLDFEDFFDFFGFGYSPSAKRIYRERLRDFLSEPGRRYWDRRIYEFASRRRPFYFRGGIGTGAWFFNIYVDRIVRLRPALDRLFAATSQQEQVRIYGDELRPRFWTYPVRRALNSRSVLAFSGIPTSQLRHARQHVPDVAEHLDRCALEVLGQVPLRDNYFWQLYVNGTYTRECCPEYLKQENFDRLKAGLAERVTIHTSTVSDFLREIGPQISRFAFLDHFDWFYGQPPKELSCEWQAIVDCAKPDARFVWRSMGEQTDFIHDCPVRFRGKSRHVGDLLVYDHELAETLKKQERVNAYSSLLIAELRGG